jgi:hypothetical protein
MDGFVETLVSWMFRGGALPPPLRHPGAISQKKGSLIFFSLKDYPGFQQNASDWKFQDQNSMANQDFWGGKGTGVQRELIDGPVHPSVST